MSRATRRLVYALTLLAWAGTARSDHRADGFLDQLRFEADHVGTAPLGWGGGPRETIHVDEDVVHEGRFAARIERDDRSERSFSSITRAIPLDFAGDRLVLEAFLRTEDVVGSAGLWLRIDGHEGSLAFDNMHDRALSGTTDWARYTITLAIPAGGREVYFGGLLSGTGTVWVDAFSLSVDGVAVSESAVVEREPTVLESDTAFDEGSGVTLDALSAAQVDALDLLCRVWGFLKYHHPAVTGGTLHWDYALFRALPDVLGAPDLAAARAAVHRWAEGTVGVPEPCAPCATPAPDRHLEPDLAWLADEEWLGETLALYLRTVHERRHTGSEQFYVSLHRGVRNPAFDNELAYKFLEDVDAGYRLLALFRYWNIIQYWFPYRDVIGTDWNTVVRELAPTFAAATTHDAYELALHLLITRVNDTHANLWSALDVRPPGGSCKVAAGIQWVEGRALVRDSQTPLLEVGDVIQAIDGTAVGTALEDWRPYYSASNEPTRHRDLMRSLTRGPCGPVRLTIERDGSTLDVDAERIEGPEVPRWHDRAGETFQLLSDEIAYLKLSGASQADAASYVTRAEGTRGLVIDIRNYPAEFMVFALGRHLVDAPTPFARFTRGDLESPGAFVWTEVVAIEPATPRYEGRLAILIDEVSQSQSEYTTMAFRAAPGAIVVGSTTAGADGNASWFSLPGGERSMISGIGVFYPDRTPTQRIGIVPDVEVRPTVAGIRAGRDEVLEAAVRVLLGDGADDARVRELAKRP